MYWYIYICQRTSQNHQTIQAYPSYLPRLGTSSHRVDLHIHPTLRLEFGSIWTWPLHFVPSVTWDGPKCHSHGFSMAHRNRWFSWPINSMVNFFMAMLVITRWYIIYIYYIHHYPSTLLEQTSATSLIILIQFFAQIIRRKSVEDFYTYISHKYSYISTLYSFLTIYKYIHKHLSHYHNCDMIKGCYSSELACHR